MRLFGQLLLKQAGLNARESMVSNNLGPQLWLSPTCS
jgi:hypothetical protein